MIGLRSGIEINLKENPDETETTENEFTILAGEGKRSPIKFGALEF